MNFERFKNIIKEELSNVFYEHTLNEVFDTNDHYEIKLRDKSILTLKKLIDSGVIDKELANEKFSHLPSDKPMAIYKFIYMFESKKGIKYKIFFQQFQRFDPETEKHKILEVSFERSRRDVHDPIEMSFEHDITKKVNTLLEAFKDVRERYPSLVEGIAFVGSNTSGFGASLESKRSRVFKKVMEKKFGAKPTVEEDYRGNPHYVFRF